MKNIALQDVPDSEMSTRLVSKPLESSRLVVFMDAEGKALKLMKIVADG